MNTSFPPGITGLTWLLATLLPLLFLQRRLHREIVSVFFLATRKLDLALSLFSLIFFPGVVLHELSHWLLARILGVQTGRISLVPERTPEGALRMGYVETQKSDLVRETLIGAAPLLVGGAFVGFAGLSQLSLNSVWESLAAFSLAGLGDLLLGIYQRQDFWLWFYLIFVVSSMMLPSESDRRSWLPLLGFGAILLVIALLAGAGDWMLEHLAPVVDEVFNAAAVVFGISSIVHVLFLIPTWLLRKLLNRVTGLRVE